MSNKKQALVSERVVDGDSEGIVPIEFATDEFLDRVLDCLVSRKGGYQNAGTVWVYCGVSPADDRAFFVVGGILHAARLEESEESDGQ